LKHGLARRIVHFAPLKSAIHALIALFLSSVEMTAKSPFSITHRIAAYRRPPLQ